MAFQQFPNGTGMALHAVRSTNHQHCIIQHLERALHLAGKIHMARGVQQGNLHAGPLHHCLFGKNGNTPFPFHGVGIQKGILVIHPSQGFNGSRTVQKPFRQGCFACIYMGQKPHRNAFVSLGLLLHNQTPALPYQVNSIQYTIIGHCSRAILLLVHSDRFAVLTAG